MLNRWIVSFLAVSAFGQSIPTFCANNARTCANTSETILTPANIVTGKFRQLGSFLVTGQVYAQPLISSGYLVVATMAGNLCAFNASAPGAAALWCTHLSDPRTTFEAPRGGESFYNQPLGVMSTPVIDTSAGYVYAVCAGPGNATGDASWAIYKVGLTTGTVAASTTIAGTVSGSGDGGSTVTFSAYHEIQRSSLLLANGKVYVGFGSYADQDPWYGWLFSYSATTLAKVDTYNFSPNQRQSGLWGSSGGPAADGSGNIYVTLGNNNGTYNPPSELTESVVKMSSSLAVLDWFTTADYASRDTNDYDLGSGFSILIPGTNLLAVAGKLNQGFIIDITDMGHLQGTGTAPQVITKASVFTPGAGVGTFAGSMYMNSRMYWHNKGGFQGENKLFSFLQTGTTFATSPSSTSATSVACCGIQPFGSSNGASNGIIWVLTPDSSLFAVMGTGTLRAYDPVTLAEIYTGPSIGNMPKFMHPIVSNGVVYVATLDGSVLAFGLCSQCGTVTAGRTITPGKTIR